MKRPKVSVCVPVYNAERYVSDCLDSLITQTLNDLEIVCVDDGSTDESPKILDEYARKYKNIKVIHQKNTGLGGARDTGVENASGEYIGFIDADDKADSKMYEELYNLAKAKNAEIAFCNVLLSRNDTGKTVWFNPYKGKVTGEFLYRNTQPWNKIFSNELFKRLDAKFKKDDSICNLLMIKAHGIISTNKKMYYYRVGHDSMSTVLKLANLTDSIESSLELRAIIDDDPDVCNDLRLFFDFLIINVTIQTLAVAVAQGDSSVYGKHVSTLKKLNYRKNGYCKSLLKHEQGCIKYFAIMNILPNSYKISRFLICNVLRGKLR